MIGCCSLSDTKQKPLHCIPTDYLLLLFYPLIWMQEIYDRLPRNSIELLGGACLTGGSLAVSKMVLAAILQGYGAAYIADLIDKSLLEEALIEVYGRKQPAPKPPASYADLVEDLPLARMGSELRMNLYMLDQFGVKGRDQVIKIGEDALTPDMFLTRDPEDERQHEYFFDGAPELIIDFVHPATRDYDEKVRLPLYQKLGAAEIWLVDAQREVVNVFFRQEEAYQQRNEAGKALESLSLPGLKLHCDKFWTIKQNPWKNYRGLVSYHDTGSKAEVLPTPGFSTHTGNFQLPFAPEIRLESTPIRFDEFISWAPEAKFEWDNGRPHIGGGYHTNLHLTGLLLMTCGLKEAVSMLPADDWQELL